MPIDSLRFDLTDKEAPKSEPVPGTKARRGRPPGSGTKVASQKQMQDEITASLKFVAMMWGMKDDHCAPILNQISADIAVDLAAFASKSKWARNILTKATDIGPAVSFALKIKPLVEAIREHHIDPAIAARNARVEQAMRDAEPEYAGNGFVG